MIGASKAAMESLVRHLAAELGPEGIRVNNLTPGSVLTDAWDAMPDKEERIRQMTEKTPLKRLVSKEEIAYTAQFLASESASGITGQSIVVDGGASIVI
jgi:enoyl-[acyl-carrier-protein] reductase (NADH)